MQGKGHHKDELHQWDELKQNQGVQLEDLLEQHWNNRGDTFTQPVEGYSLAGKEKPHTGEAVLLSPHWAHNSSRLPGTKEQTGTLENRDSQDGRILDDNKTVSFVDNTGSEVKKDLEEGENGQLLDQSKGEVREETQSPSLQDDTKPSKGHTDGFTHPVTWIPQVGFGHTETGGSWLKPIKEPNPDPREWVRQRDNETPEEVRVVQEEEENVEREREELLLLHKKLDQEKVILRQKQLDHEEKERQKGKKTASHLQSKHHHHHPQTTQAPGKRNYPLLTEKLLKNC